MKPHRRWLFTIRCNTKDELVASQIQALVLTTLRGFDPTVSMEMTSCMTITGDDAMMAEPEEPENDRPAAN